MNYKPKKALRNENEIIAEYIDGSNMSELAKKYNYDRSSIRNILNRNKINLRPCVVLLHGLEEKVAMDHLGGMPLKQVAKKYNVSVGSVLNALKRIESPTRNQSIANRKYGINETFFDFIDTEEKAYILGFIYADGCHFPAKHRLSIEIQVTDIALLERIRLAFLYDGPISFQPAKVKVNKSNKKNIKVGEMAKLCIHNVRISQCLLNLGVHQNKTYFVEFPQWIDPSLMHHFVRGFFDGDGTVGDPKTKYKVINRRSDAIGRANIGFIGHRDFIIPLQKILSHECLINFSSKISHPYGHKDIITISAGGRQNVLKLRRYLYREASIYLERKKDRFDGFASQVFQPKKVPEREVALCQICGKEAGTKSLFCKSHYNYYYNVFVRCPEKLGIKKITDSQLWMEEIKKRNLDVPIIGKRLAPDQILEILKKASEGVSVAQLAKYYRVALSTIKRIKNGRSASQISGLIKKSNMTY